VNLKAINPKLITMLAVGGASDKLSAAFSTLASSITARTSFAANLIALSKRFLVDGIDIDWEFPESADDRRNFIALLGELSEAFKTFNLILSVAVAPDKWRAKDFYEIQSISQIVDFINLMTYDFHGSWSPKVSHHAQMYPHHNDSDYMRELNCAASVTYWLINGAAPEKLNLGIPTYGKTFVLADKKNHKITSDVNSNETKAAQATIGYDEYCTIKQTGWKQQFDTNYRVYYAVKGLSWLGFDSIQQVEMKAKYVKAHKLGGVMFWSLDTDDYSGNCESGKFPLISSAYKELNKLISSGN